MLSREHCRRLGEETVQILEKGAYTSYTGLEVDLSEDLALSQENTVYYPEPDLDKLLTSNNRTASSAGSTVTSIANISSFDALRELESEGKKNIAVLNFASGRNPGGGFLGGARAQEECLCRSSGLYPCLTGKGDGYYTHNRSIKPNLGVYSDGMVYSPNVPVFRLEDGELVSRPVSAAILTVPAVNATVYRQRMLGKSKEDVEKQIEEIMARRIRNIFRVMDFYGHDVIVLGAWGCGAFGNKPERIASLFYKLLKGSGMTWNFSTVFFAVLDKTPKQENFLAFNKYFGS